MPDPIIELAGVEVRYGARVALDDVTVQVGGGAIGLLGPNGAGKSTLIKTLLGLLPLAGGKASVLGQSVTEYGPALRRRVGYMPERDAAFPGMTGFQAAHFAARLSGLPDSDARVRAHEVLLFAGLEEARYRDVGTYSTGMRQRVKLAQALVHDPDLVFLDEPTNGLDPKGRQEMLDLVSTLSHDKGIHVVLSTHLLRDVEEVCDTVVVMQGGKLVRHEKVRTLSRDVAEAASIRIAGDAEAFALACERRGLVITSRKDRELELKLSADAGPQAVFAAAVESGAVVRLFRPVRVSLEDALIDVLGRAV